MSLNLKAQTILKIAFLIVLIGLLVYLVVKLMILGDRIDVMINAGKAFG